MTKAEALTFLRENQPLPDDERLTRDLVEKYDEIRRYFIDNPAIECVRLFLNSFGHGNGLGVYQLVEDIVGKFKCEDIVPYLVEALKSDSESVRYWNAQISVGCPSEGLLKPLAKVAKKDGRDARFAAITAIEQIKGTRAKAILFDLLENEKDDELKEIIEEAISGS